MKPDRAILARNVIDPEPATGNVYEFAEQR
jgi:hypothetical protein